MQICCRALCEQFERASAFPKAAGDCDEDDGGQSWISSDSCQRALAGGRARAGVMRLFLCCVICAQWQAAGVRASLLPSAVAADTKIAYERRGRRRCRRCTPTLTTTLTTMLTTTTPATRRARVESASAAPPIAVWPAAPAELSLTDTQAVLCVRSPAVGPLARRPAPFMGRLKIADCTRRCSRVSSRLPLGASQLSTLATLVLRPLAQAFDARNFVDRRFSGARAAPSGESSVACARALCKIAGCTAMEAFKRIIFG